MNFKIHFFSFVYSIKDSNLNQLNLISKEEISNVMLRLVTDVEL